MAEFDVFISYRWVSPDLEWVRNELFPALKAAGLHPFLDVVDFVPGRNVVLEMSRAGQSSRAALCVISPAYFDGNRMVGYEALAARGSDPLGQESRLIPLLLSPAELPEWMRGLVPVDWTDATVHAREWRRLLQALGARHPDAPPPGAVGSSKPNGGQTTVDPQPRPLVGSWRPRLIFMKVNPKILRSYVVYAALLVCTSAAALWISAAWQHLPFLVEHANSTGWAHAMPMLMQTLVCSLVGVALLVTLITDLLNMQIVFSTLKTFFLLAFFSFACAIVTLVSHESMIPHAVLALLLIVTLAKHFVLGSLGYYWKSRSFGDAAAEAVLLLAFVTLILGPLRHSF